MRGPVGCPRLGADRTPVEHLDCRSISHLSLPMGTVMTDVDAIRWMASEHDLEFVDLENYGIDPAAGEILPVELARRHHMVAIKRKFGTPVIATADPDDLSAQDAVRASIGRDFISVVAAPEQIERYIDRVFGPEAPEPEVLDAVEHGFVTTEAAGPVVADIATGSQGPELDALSLAPLPEEAAVYDVGGTDQVAPEFEPVEQGSTTEQVEGATDVGQIDGDVPVDEVPAQVEPVDVDDPPPLGVHTDDGVLDESLTEVSVMADTDLGSAGAEELVPEDAVPANNGKGRRGKEDRKRRKLAAAEPDVSEPTEVVTVASPDSADDSSVAVDGWIGHDPAGIDESLVVDTAELGLATADEAGSTSGQGVDQPVDDLMSEVPPGSPYGAGSDLEFETLEPATSVLPSFGSDWTDPGAISVANPLDASVDQLAELALSLQAGGETPSGDEAAIAADLVDEAVATYQEQFAEEHRFEPADALDAPTGTAMFPPWPRPWSKANESRSSRWNRSSRSITRQARASPGFSLPKNW